MKIDQNNHVRWRTASFASPPDTSPAELAALGEHLRRCQRPHGKLRKARNAVDRLNAFLIPRFVSTLVLGALLTIAACMTL